MLRIWNPFTLSFCCRVGRCVETEVSEAAFDNVSNVNVAKIIDFLFQEGVLRHQDACALQRQNHPQQQCRDLSMLLHKSDHPQGFVQLYRAIKSEPHLKWLVDCIREYSDESVKVLCWKIATSASQQEDVLQ